MTLGEPRKIYSQTLLLIFAFTLVLTGCASVSNVIEKTRDVDIPLISSESPLKKKVGLITPAPHFGVQNDDTSGVFQQRLAAYLSTKCSDILLISADAPDGPRFLASPPMAPGTTGIDNLKLAEYSRRHGFSACVAVTIEGVSVDAQKSGFVWFKDTREMARIRIHADVYGARTGAKILFEDFVESVELSPGERELLEAGHYGRIAAVGEAVMDMAADAGRKICQALEDEPWKGFIVAVEDGQAVISSGSDVGIKVGDVFAMQGIQGTVEGPDGTRYRIPGNIIGDIEITAVSAGRSKGISVSGKAIEAGNTIRIKRE